MWFSKKKKKKKNPTESVNNCDNKQSSMHATCPSASCVYVYTCLYTVFIEYIIFIVVYFMLYSSKNIEQVVHRCKIGLGLLRETVLLKTYIPHKEMVE